MDVRPARAAHWDVGDTLADRFRAHASDSQNLYGYAMRGMAEDWEAGGPIRLACRGYESEVDLERGAGLAAGPFLRVASRTRRAPLSAPGSPQAPWVCGFPQAVLGQGVGMRVPR
jgi:hypothetical protein